MKPVPLIWNGELINKFWDFYSHYPEEYFTYQYGDHIVEHFSKEIPKRSKILDYGCGTGFIIKHLIGRDYEVYGTDSSEESVQFTNNQYRGVSNFKGAYMLQDIQTLNQKFDIILVIEVIEHLDDHFLFSLLDNIKKLLNPGGKIIFTTPNAEDLERSLVYCPNCNHTFHRWQHVRQWTVDSLSYILEKKGFQNIISYTTNFTATETKNVLKKLNRFIRRSFKPVNNPHLVAVCSFAENKN